MRLTARTSMVVFAFVWVVRAVDGEQDQPGTFQGSALSSILNAKSLGGVQLVDADRDL